MKRYSVSLEGFKFIQFTDSDGAKRLTRSRKEVGKSDLCTVHVVDALSKGDAIARFQSLMGIRSTKRDYDVREVAEAKSAKKA